MGMTIKMAAIGGIMAACSVAGLAQGATGSPEQDKMFVMK